MRTVTLALGIHNHQPLGNFDSVFEHAYEHSYRPFLDVLRRHAHVRLSQHYSGILLAWLAAHHPEFIEQLTALVAAGQVEMMTGAYYEAILPAIPDADKLLQIRKLSAEIRRLFHVTPQGMWLAERVWEAFLAKPIADAGVKFIAVDDSHFKHAGLTEEELLGYFVTEEQGAMLRVFPISKRLRYAIPFQPVEATTDYLRSAATEDGQTVVVFADDGEKFGVWPKTFKHVYEEGWLDRFFTALDVNSDWIRVRHFSDIADNIPPRGRIYLPNASYAEMMHWALPPKTFLEYEEMEKFLEAVPRRDVFEKFVRGGFWRNFLAKYPEANQMHKKMLRVSSRVHAAARRRNPPRQVRKALDHLLGAQCNDAYWHGVFGGLYLPNVRFPVYRSLIDAERALDRIVRPRGVAAEVTDFDCDGHDEVLVESDVVNAYFKPSEGGRLFELDFKPGRYNILDIVSRHEEGYHRKLREAAGAGGCSTPAADDVASIHDVVQSKETGLEKLLTYDWYQHGSFVDHFFGEGLTLEGFGAARYPELGDFVNRPYAASVKKVKGGIDLRLIRTGGVWSGNERRPVRVRKTLHFSSGSSTIDAEYVIENLDGTPFDVWFGVEFAFGFMAGDAHDRYYEFEGVGLDDRRLRSCGIVEDCTRASVVDEWLKVRACVGLEVPAAWLRTPIETVSLSEAGFERVYQGTICVPNWKFRLEKRHGMRVRLSLSRR